MPEDIVRDIIAHELAHVYQFALGMRYGPEGPRSEQEFVGVDGEDRGDVVDIENRSPEIMSNWGFDPKSLNRWAISTGRIEGNGEFQEKARCLRTLA
jgi:hypothetical protein